MGADNQTPDDVVSKLNHALTTLTTAVTALERNVNGDVSLGLKSLRVVSDELRATVDQIQRERSTEAAEKRGLNRALTWIFGSSLASAVGLAVILIKLFGSGGSP